MNTCYVVRSSRPAGLFSFGLLDGLHARLRRPYLQEAQAGFGLERFCCTRLPARGCTQTGRSAAPAREARDGQSVFVSSHTRYAS